MHGKKHASHLPLQPQVISPSPEAFMTHSVPALSAQRRVRHAPLAQMHSKLGTGRVPSMEELISSIELAMGS